MSKGSEEYFWNSKDRCEPDCPWLVIDAFEDTAVCSYYNETLMRMESFVGDAVDISQSPWLICESCLDDCSDFR